MIALLPRQHAAAALGAGVLIIGIPLALLVIPAWQARVEFWERKATLEQQYARYASLAARTAQLKQGVEQLVVKSADRSGFLQETSPSLAAAALQRKIQMLIETQGGNMQSAQSVPVATKAGFPAVSVQVQAHVSMAGLGNILVTISGDSTLLEVDNVFIQARNAGGSQASDANTLEARFQVTGYLFKVQEP